MMPCAASSVSVVHQRVSMAANRAAAVTPPRIWPSSTHQKLRSIVPNEARRSTTASGTRAKLPVSRSTLSNTTMTSPTGHNSEYHREQQRADEVDADFFRGRDGQDCSTGQ